MLPCVVYSKSPMESARTYYNHMVQITGHPKRTPQAICYRPGELARMSKDCFYAGLLPENRPMVVHLKDQLHTTPSDLLRVHCWSKKQNDALDMYSITPLLPHPG